MTALPNPFATIDADAAGAAEPDVSAAAPSGENYIPELFSALARRRSMAIVSPPLPDRGLQNINRFDALFDPQRFFEDIEPPPLFLREPQIEPGETR
jgi:hypothetical protein